MELPPTPSLSEADVLILLSEKRYRQTLRIVQRSALPLTAIEVARRIANCEYDDPSAQEIQTIHRALRTDYLPRLDEADVVEYDTNGGTTRPGMHFDTVMSVLTNVNETSLPWSGQ
ncbi:MAG: DUF7344 domain-containing protein [Halanaeroarchaeum sp.]